MKKRKLLVMGLLILLSVSLAACGKSTASHKAGSSSTEQPYSRVVAGTRTVAQYLDLYKIKLVGVANEEGMPARYTHLKKVGQPRELNVEAISGLKPDLFIGDKGFEAMSSHQLQAANIKSRYLDSSSYDKVFQNVKTVGKLFNQESKTNGIIKKLKSGETKALAGSEKLKGKKVLLLFGTGSGYMAATKHSFLGSLLTKLGVTNVADGLPKSQIAYAPISLESAVAKNPDVILTLAHGNKAIAKKAFSAEMKKALWQKTNAVKHHRVYPIDDQKYPVTGNIHAVSVLNRLKELLLNGQAS